MIIQYTVIGSNVVYYIKIFSVIGGLIFTIQWEGPLVWSFLIILLKKPYQANPNVTLKSVPR